MSCRFCVPGWLFLLSTSVRQPIGSIECNTKNSIVIHTIFRNTFRPNFSDTKCDLARKKLERIEIAKMAQKTVSDWSQINDSKYNTHETWNEIRAMRTFVNASVYECKSLSPSLARYVYVLNLIYCFNKCLTKWCFFANARKILLYAFRIFGQKWTKKILTDSISYALIVNLFPSD